MKNIFKQILGFMLAAFALMFGFIPASFAALPAAATAGLTTLQADVLDLVDAIWPVMVAITVAFILLRVFKRGANSAV
ncbi:major coat protein [Methylomicrobium sp. Wu6]|uniref:major coat protein n=1 Tax=Methylomicrobium sp. Wu6 TaxID=3107928 RepID=UPI002DD67F4B|nr:major coat protein [Methylomicrobium sp. Wu6]MEC4749809.1 major coat protein [Methylomicrobium sp. Wu6]